MATTYGGDPGRKIMNSSFVWTNNCTVGAGIKRFSDSWPGYVTAGHCASADIVQSGGASYFGGVGQWDQVYSWPQEFEQCGGASDSQIHPTWYSANAGNYRNYFDWNPPNAWFTPVYDVALGFYIGQPIRRVGRFSSSSSTVTEWGSWTVNFSSSSCSSSSGQVTGFRTGTISIVGDSGGGAFLQYNNAQYFAGVLSGGTGNAIISWWGYMPAFSNGWGVCTTVSPC